LLCFPPRHQLHQVENHILHPFPGPPFLWNTFVTVILPNRCGQIILNVWSRKEISYLNPRSLNLQICFGDLAGSHKAEHSEYINPKKGGGGHYAPPSTFTLFLTQIANRTDSNINCKFIILRSIRYSTTFWQSSAEIHSTPKFDISQKSRLPTCLA
jgi:hypothetical protein